MHFEKLFHLSQSAMKRNEYQVYVWKCSNPIPTTNLVIFSVTSNTTSMTRIFLWNKVIIKKYMSKILNVDCSNSHKTCMITIWWMKKKNFYRTHKNDCCIWLTIKTFKNAILCEIVKEMNFLFFLFIFTIFNANYAEFDKMETSWRIYLHKQQQFSYFDL